MGKCIAWASVFSGRPDPEWSLDDETLGFVERTWETLKPSLEQQPTSPILGYRGCYIKCPEGNEWFIYKTFVKLNIKGDVVIKYDANMELERKLINSAPKIFRLPSFVWNNIDSDGIKE